MAMVITKENFKKEVLESDKPVIVDFWAEWCTPCKMLAPVLEEIANERQDIKVCKVDVDAEFELATEYAIMSIPTVMAFKDGKVINKSVGVVAKNKIIELVK